MSDEETHPLVQFSIFFLGEAGGASIDYLPTRHDFILGVFLYVRMSGTMQLWITRLFLVLPLTSIRNAFAFVPPPLATSSTTIGQRNDQALLLMVDGLHGDSSFGSSF